MPVRTVVVAAGDVPAIRRILFATLADAADTIEARAEYAGAGDLRAARDVSFEARRVDAASGILERIGWTKPTVERDVDITDLAGALAWILEVRTGADDRDDADAKRALSNLAGLWS